MLDYYSKLTALDLFETIRGDMINTYVALATLQATIFLSCVINLALTSDGFTFLFYKLLQFAILWLLFQHLHS